MRELPRHVEQAVKARDPLASVVWEEKRHVWALEWDGVRICDLFHSDDTPMVEACVEEILGAMGRYDNWQDGPERLEAITRNAMAAKAKARERAEILKEEARRESEKVTDVFSRGVSPQIYIHNNPVCNQ
jgi:hypothetical protein